MASEEDQRAVERTWLAAGKSGDVEKMRNLLRAHSLWLALDRVVEQDEREPQPRSSPRSQVSDWSGFALRTVGASALHAAVWTGNARVLRFLLEAGQNVDARDDWEMTPLMAVVMRHTLPLIRCVFRGRVAVPRHLAMDCRQEMAERTAAALSIVHILLQFGTDLEARNADGKTALMLAANDDTFEIAQLLLERGAQVDAQDHNGSSALRHSVDAKSLLALNLLLEHRADIDLPDARGVTPLNVIVARNLGNQLQIVINHHALVSTASRLDFSGAVLVEAVSRDVVDIVQFLLEDEHVAVEYRNAAGETTFHHVQSPQVIEMLCRFDSGSVAFRHRTKTGDSCLHYAARIGSRHVLNTLLEHHERMMNDSAAAFTDDLVVSANVNGATPLFEAATSTSESLDARNRKSELLLSFNAPLFPADWSPWTADPESSSSISLAPSVRTCLELWLPKKSDQVLTDFCTNWVACAHFSSRAVPIELLHLTIFAGFAADVVPLLVLLPLLRVNLPKFVDLVGEFAGWRNHRLLLQLHTEMLAASVSRT